MIPVVTVAEMQAIDAAATDPVETLIERAGRAVAAAALDMLGGAYGRRVTVVAGSGNNGADGRVAAELLTRRGVRVQIVDAHSPYEFRRDTDLVIDAALGTGLSRPYDAPPFDGPVLAVDIPSGFDGDTGQPHGNPVHADRTVTFAALKPGLLLSPARWHTGPIDLADIGLGGWTNVHLVQTDDVVDWIPRRPSDSHKWKQAVAVVAGSPTMTGAAHLAASAAQRAGAGMVLLASPGVSANSAQSPVEVVRLDVADAGWAEEVLARSDRVHAVVVGPGLGTSMVARHQIRQLVTRYPGPVVVDGDGLTALGSDAADVLRDRAHATVLTPHDGEFARLAGGPPGHDRIAAARDLAAELGAVILLKGPTTVVADPLGRVHLSMTGDERLATAGTGDVLSGMIGAFLAGGIDGPDAAVAAAHVHGLCAQAGPPVGLVAGDLVDVLPDVLEAVLAGDHPAPHVAHLGRFR